MYNFSSINMYILCVDIVIIANFKKFYLIIILFASIVIFTLCFYYINSGIIEKNFNKFRTGLMISLIFAISCFILKISLIFLIFF